MRVFRKFQSSDGRIKIATLSGVSALVAVIALLVGVLPVMADHGGEHPLVEPDFVQYGGGSGACDFVEVDSAASNELHTNNPMDQILEGTDGTRIEIDVTGNTFSFEVLTPGMAVYDVVVNGGPHNNHYDYDGSVVGTVTYDEGLHAPLKNNGDLNNLSHINICYDIQPVSFVCGTTSTALNFGDGSFEGATATIFANSLFTCTDKDGFFFIDGDTATLDFGDGTGTVAGRADFTKDFGDPALFEDLTYDGPGEFVDLQWCEIRTKDTTVDADGLKDGDEFDDVLETDEYPSLVGVTDTLDGGTPNDTSDDTTVQATACKVAEIENAAGIQDTVVYFQFVDPNFR